MKPIKIAIVDDHTMISKAIENMISENEKYTVISNSCNGEDFIIFLEKHEIHPEIVLMDLNMPFKNGIETTKWLSENHPEIKVIALTMDDNEETILKMIRAGAKGYLLKDMHPEILFEALEMVYNKGSFYTDFVTQSLLKIKEEGKEKETILNNLKERELEFIKLACREMTYKEIAAIMCLSPKTIDGYRDSVFIKLQIKSRVGLVLFGIKNGLCK